MSTLDEQKFQAKLKEAKRLFERLKGVRKATRLFAMRQRAFVDFFDENPDFRKELLKREGDPTVAYLVAAISS